MTSRILAVLLAVVVAQTGSPRLSFEVASIHPAALNPGQERGPQEKVEFGADRLTVRNAPLNTLLQVAFRATQAQIGDHPASNQRFDIDAKAAGPSSRDQLRQMLQTLLADRFKLAMHRELKEETAYVLVQGKNGHKLHEASGGPDDGWEMINLVMGVWGYVNQPVVDMTGLRGRYDNKIDWHQFNDPADPESAARYALSTQFGLGLERRKTQVEFFAIDHLEKTPSEN